MERSLPQRQERCVNFLRAGFVSCLRKWGIRMIASMQPWLLDMTTPRHARAPAGIASAGRVRLSFRILQFQENHEYHGAKRVLPADPDESRMSEPAELRLWQAFRLVSPRSNRTANHDYRGALGKLASMSSTVNEFFRQGPCDG